jgi:hypothetical protein
VKSHDVAKMLMQLARILQKAPNVDLSDLSLTQPQQLKMGDMAIGLTTLVELSKIDKRQWLSLIVEYGLPIEIRARDSSRDILGKLLKYLDEHPEAQKKLKESVYKRPSEASPELMEALSLLLKG